MEISNLKSQINVLETKNLILQNNEIQTIKIQPLLNHNRQHQRPPKYTPIEMKEQPKNNPRDKPDDIKTEDKPDDKSLTII
jgi:hypothetical protein